MEAVKRFGLVDSKTVSTPFETRSLLGVEGCPKSKEERVAMEGIPYISLVGRLMYLVACRRPDLAMGVSILGRFC